MSGRILRVWVDLLCSECYRSLGSYSADDYDKRLEKCDETEYCDDCHDFVFPIVIMKREYDVRLAPPIGNQGIERDIQHGIEILHIDGEGIVKNCECGETGSLNKTYYHDMKLK